MVKEKNPPSHTRHRPYKGRHRLGGFAIARNDEKSSILYMWAVFIPSPLEGEGWEDGKREKPTVAYAPPPLQREAPAGWLCYRSQ